ncbi:hypothetical protein CLV29_1878 [Naumannella halotolerans]|uniref:Probable membrane transporter protein n=2 Tax=Naumannella halotolerans TaxID=993414 RepID=A0A4R7J9L0_9ACTN|nr:hypothetical protein CLV29_1878 [Naumannella halotolerans]
MLITCCAVVILGAALQRVAGMGMGLVAAPMLTLLLGPLVGVTMSNSVAVVAATLVMLATHQHVDWRRWLQMAPLLLIGTAAGTLAVDRISIAWLDVLVGLSVLLALFVSFLMARTATVRGGRPLAMGAGFAAGFMNTTSGVAAPALTAYGLAIKWEQRSFAATLQPTFLVANVASLVAKAGTGAVPLTSLPAWWATLILLAAVPVGVFIGRVLHSRTPVAVARGLGVAIALIGGVVAAVRGFIAI